MSKLRRNNGKVNIMLIILLIIIVIAGIVLALKMTGVIKPEEKDYNNITTNSITSNLQSITNNTKPITNITFQTAKIMSSAFIITILVIEIGLNIGICKLYKKLQMPGYIITFTFLWPILNIIHGFFDNWFGTILSIIYSILQIASLFYYFKSVGMSGAWAFVPTASTLIMGVGTSALILGGNGFMAMIGLIALVGFLIAYIISNIKLAKIFNKGTGFTVGLALLPIIFQPILGYSRIEKSTYQ